MTTRSNLALLPALAALALTGCAGASVAPLYRDASYGSPPVKKIFVVASMSDKARPANFENAVAQALAARGYQVAAYTSVFPPGRVDKYAVQDYVAKNGTDLVVMLRLTSRSEPVVVTSTAVAGNAFGPVVAGTQSTVVGTDTEVTARIEVFDARREPNVLVWAGQSNEVDLQQAPESMAKALVGQLVDARILAK